MISGFIRRKDKGVLLAGVDHGGYGKILKENHDYVVIKWPAHMAWSGISERSYVPAHTVVYNKEMKQSSLSDRTEYSVYCEALIEWDNTRKKRS